MYTQRWPAPRWQGGQRAGGKPSAICAARCSAACCVETDRMLPAVAAQGALYNRHPGPHGEVKALHLKKINFIFSRLKKNRASYLFFAFGSHLNFWKGDPVPETVPNAPTNQTTRDQPFTSVTVPPPWHSSLPHITTCRDTKGQQAQVNSTASRTWKSICIK